jgi:hypothetical protein
MAERDISALALGGGIRSGARGQRLHELVMKLPGLRDQCLILLGVVAEHFGDRGRHLVLGRSRHLRSWARCRRRPNRRPDTGQILRRCGESLW